MNSVSSYALLSEWRDSSIDISGTLRYKLLTPGSTVLLCKGLGAVDEGDARVLSPQC